MTTGLRDPRHLVIYEPRVEGHHLPWLGFIARDLLSAGCRLALAVNKDPENQAKLRDHLGPLMDECQIIPADHPDSIAASQRLTFIQSCLAQTGASSVFLGAYDEVASALARRAFFGRYPPTDLKGRIGGVYHRPRFTIAHPLSPNRWLKQIGFGRLMRGQWLRQLFVLDPDLARQWQDRYPGASVHFLPDPCPEMKRVDPAAARNALNLGPKNRMFLFYGVGSRRKGLHIAADAFSQLPPETNSVLYCAGSLKLDGAPGTKQRLSDLEKLGRARIIDRFVTADETEQLFAAADFVLLPYLGHFGSSGVLSQAAAAAKPVIASDYDLLGRLVRRHHIGLLFRSGVARELAGRISEAAGADDAQLRRWQSAARAFAALYSRSAFRVALLEGIVPAANPAA
jgi:glycosyltransferase involved in cell wall biosynthesis